MGVPVVATDLPGTRDHIAELAAVELVEPGDVRSMAAAIAASVDPAKKKAALAQVEVVRSRYRWPAEDVLAFYTCLVNP
jgi:glycosyltransferase involved in cell wall biosynthesis